MTRPIAFASLLCFAGVLTAQQVTLPSAVATTRPTSSPFYASFVFYGSSSQAADSRAQLIYDVNDIPVPVATWSSLSVRRPVGLGNANPALNGTATITMSVSPLSYTSVTNTFANNHGPTTTVLSGPISLPAESNPGVWPAQWHTLPFGTPFTYIGATGASLVIDIQQSSPGLTAPWYLEAWTPDTGSRTNNGPTQPNCRFSTGTYNNAIGHRNPTVGGSWYVQYHNVVPNSIGFAAIGVQGVGGTWNGIPLPIDLTPLGAPNCEWRVSADFTIPLSSNSSGRADWPQITIPNDPWFRNVVFYDHGALLDPTANALGLVVTWSSAWRIGTNEGQPGAVVSATGNSANNPTGSVAIETTVSVQLN